MAGLQPNIRCSDCGSRATLTEEQSATLVRRLKVTYFCPGCRDERTYSLITKPDLSRFDSFGHDEPEAIPEPQPPSVPVRNVKPKPPPFAAAPAPPWEPPVARTDDVEYDREDAPPPFDRPGDPADVPFADAPFPHPGLVGPSESTARGGLRGRWSRLSNGKQMLILGGVIAAAAVLVLAAPWEGPETPLVLDFLPSAVSADALVPRTSSTATTSRP